MPLVPMFDHFDSPRALLDRARKHIRDFEVKEAWFSDKRKYRQFHEIDPDTGDTLLKAALTESLPKELPAIAFDIINCLRSALDHAIFDASAALLNKPDPKYTKFPFSKCPDQLSKDLLRKGGEVPVAIHPLLLSFEPHKGGKHKLWEFNEIRNGKIHKTLSPIIASSGGVGINNGYIKNATLSGMSEWNGENGELTYFRIHKGSKLTANFKLMVQVAFDESTPFPLQKTLPLLKEFAGTVDMIVTRIQDEVATTLKKSA